MAKFELRVVFQVPIWGYTEVEADSLDDALDLAENHPDLFDLDFNDTDAAPGDPEMEDVFFEVKDEKGKWIAAT